MISKNVNNPLLAYTITLKFHFVFRLKTSNYNIDQFTIASIQRRHVIEARVIPHSATQSPQFDVSFSEKLLKIVATYTRDF